MEIYNSLDKIPSDIKSSTLTIGTFDGMHLGHQYLVSELVKHSLENNNQSVLISFYPNPYIIINNKEKSDYHLISKTDKYQILDALGVNILFEVNFNCSLSKVRAGLFLKEFIIDPFKPKDILIGHDHHFGYKREGNSHFLTLNENNYNYKVRTVNAFQKDQLTISSSMIRNLIKEEDILKANTLLGRNYRIKGKVVEGDKIGRSISFPTANISISSINQIIPSNGVYFIKTYINGNKYSGMCNIGFRPTISREKNRRVEVHLFNYDDFNLYRQFIEIEFVDYIRSEIKFNNKAELKCQLSKDKEYCESLIT